MSTTDMNGRALWRSVSIRRAGVKLKAGARLGARAAARGAALLLAAAAGAFSVAAAPEFFPRLVYCSAAAAAPGAALELLAARWTETSAPESEPAESEAAPPAPESFAAPAVSAPTSEHEYQDEPEEAPFVPQERRGIVLTEQYGAGAGGIYLSFGAASVRNGTELSNERVAAELAKPLELGFEHDSRAPQVLILHTHATECYEPADRGYFDLEYVWRSQDPERNMLTLGEEAARVLSERGIGVIHDMTLHDSPSYNGSYARSAETISAYLAEHPSIKVVLDLHRDAIEPERGVIIKPTATVNGQSAAQVMLLCGCDDGTMDMPGYFSNLRLAAALSDRLERLAPGLTRPVYFAYQKYNMDLSPGLVLAEIGASGNTLAEAKYSATLFAEALAALLLEGAA